MYKLPQQRGEQALWVAQDARGGVWRVDLSHSHTVAEPVKLLSCQAGDIRGLAACPTAHYVAAAGVDGSIRVFRYKNNQTVFSSVFSAPVTSLLWLPVLVK